MSERRRAFEDCSLICDDVGRRCDPDSPGLRDVMRMIRIRKPDAKLLELIQSALNSSFRSGAAKCAWAIRQHEQSADQPCAALHPTTNNKCERTKGHDGDHEALRQLASPEKWSGT